MIPRHGALLFLAIYLLVSFTSPVQAQSAALAEALKQGEQLVEPEAQVQTEVVIPIGVAVHDGWIELTSLVSPEHPPVVLPLAQHPEDAESARWTPKLPNGPAMLCYGAKGFAVRCVETYLFRGPIGDYLGPLEIEVEWQRGTPIHGRYVSQDAPIAAARVALVPTDIRSPRAFTMPFAATFKTATPEKAPLGTASGKTTSGDDAAITAPQGRLEREVLSDSEGAFVLPEVAPGSYFLETLLPTGRLHRSEAFDLPQRSVSQGRLAASEEQLIFWDLGDIEVLDGAALEIRVQSTTGEMVSGAQISARQGKTVEDLLSFRATTGDDGIAVLSGFQVESAMQLSCSAPGFVSHHEDLPTVPALLLCDLEPTATLSGSVVLSGGGVSFNDAVSSRDTVSSNSSQIEQAWVSLRRLPEDGEITPSDIEAKGDTSDDRQTTALSPQSSANLFDEEPSGVLDHLAQAAQTVSRQVDSEGGFAFRELPAGNYELTAAAPRHEVLIEEVSLRAGEIRQHGTLRLMAGRQVDIVVVDATSGAVLRDVLVQSVNPPGAVDGITDEEGELAFTTRSDRGLDLRLQAEGYADALRHLTAEDLVRDKPLDRRQVRLELQRPGWIRVVIFDEALDDPCRGCTVILTPPGLELQTDELGQIISPPLEPGSYRVYRPRLTHLGSTVVEQADAERRYAKVKAGKTSLVRFGEERQIVRLTFDSDLPRDWSLRAQTPYHAERVQQRQDGSFEVRHLQGEALDLYLLFYDPRLGRMSEVRLSTLPANLSVRELKLKLRRSAIEGRLTTWQGEPLVGKPVQLASLERGIYAKVWTDGEGKFHVPYAPEGVFGLHVGQRNMRFVSVSPAQQVDVGTIQLEPGRF